MEFFESLCVFNEWFYKGCGHVVTKVKHANNCREENHDPYRHGQILGQMCDSYHIKPALIIHSLCPFCSDADYNAANVWRSDRNDEALLRVDIRPRVVYWAEYIAKQRQLFARQASLEFNARVALIDVENFVQQSPNGIPDGPEYERIGWAFLRLEKMRVWYLAQQNHHLAEIRRGIPHAERRHLFDEEVVNPDILAPVLFADIPPDEFCGICRLPLSDREAWGPNGVRRVFCGVHIYHHDCIIPWFRVNGGQHVTCPTCRARRHLLRPPIQEWAESTRAS
ncbi:feae0959-9a81-48ab-b8bb-7554c1f35bb6 [Sclerotinia trifoliorum]|uniref:Feae0959-9a81-48ab-b8bb-7554c1f35bb6 n=1 Tax=Sclerotinia trifoliorum TaxID=28548 RepID=A0A8H2VXS1_9HELO|nr:feae0959-9a81-48ab-b8bb-7554c1f35bb6 [Sclerotinia trifoliorum]